MKTDKLLNLFVAAIASVGLWLVLLAAKPAEVEHTANEALPFTVDDPMPPWAAWALRVQSVPDRVAYSESRPRIRGEWVTVRQPDRTLVVHVGAGELALVAEMVAP